MPNPIADAARQQVLGRLAVYREARVGLHADIRRAAELGLTVTEIAVVAGMSWHGVKKILAKVEQPDA